MLQITVPPVEAWDDLHEKFIYTKEQTLRLEHSLVSISKWEAKWHKPFLTDEPKTNEEMLDYIKCMTITQNVDPNVYYCLSSSNKEDINKYIEDQHTATTIREGFGTGKMYRRKEIITSELIYYWMITLNIPMECQTWHLNRLLMLIRVCNAKNSPPKKRSQREIINEYAELNAARRKQWKTAG